MFMLATVVDSLAQSYTSSNVHYYMPIGFSASDVGETILLPNHASVSSTGAFIVVDLGNRIRTALGPNNKRMSREQTINYLNAAVKGSKGALEFVYDSSMSTSKRKVYKRVVSSSMFGPGLTEYIALSPDFKSYIRWEKGREDRRVEYSEIDITETIPSAPNNDFLYE